MQKRIGATALALGLLSGCAITSSHHSGPNGRPVHWIDGTSASAAYTKAGKLCPHGYDILGAPMQVSVLDYVMTVECKAPAVAISTPSAAMTPMAPAPTAYAAPQSVSGATKQQQLQELQNTSGLSYEEYKRRYELIMGQ